MDVIFEAGLGVDSGEVHVAGRHLEIAVNEVDERGARGCRESRDRSKWLRLLQTAGDVDARILFVGQLDIRVGLVVAQQDVEARLVLLDQIVLERQRFLFVVDQNVVDIGCLGDESAGAGSPPGDLR